MKKIKLMHLQVLPILSGVQNMMISLLSGLEKDKYEISVVSGVGGPLVDQVKELGWEHFAVKSLIRQLSIKDFIAAWQLFWLFRKVKPDVVHTHSSKTGFLGRILAKLAGVPLVIHTTHGFPFHTYQNVVAHAFYTALESFAAFFADFNVFVNQYERDIAIHKLGFSRKKAMTIYNGVLPYHKQKVYEFEAMPIPCVSTIVESVSTSPPGDGSEIVFSKGADQTLKIVSVLRFSKQKNILSTIEQAMRAVKKFDNVQFTFIGDGELFEECSKIVKNSDTGDKILLCGWVSNVQEILLQYDVFLLNSLWEGLPLSILEAMSVGLPIICSNIKGNNELVCDLNGWLIEPYDLSALENTIVEILNDRSVLIEKGKESLKRVTNLFHYELFISRYKNLYNGTGQTESEVEPECVEE